MSWLCCLIKLTFYVSGFPLKPTTCLFCTEYLLISPSNFGALDRLLRTRILRCFSLYIAERQICGNSPFRFCSLPESILLRKGKIRQSHEISTKAFTHLILSQQHEMIFLTQRWYFVKVSRKKSYFPNTTAVPFIVLFFYFVLTYILFLQYLVQRKPKQITTRNHKLLTLMVISPHSPLSDQRVPTSHLIKYFSAFEAT